MNERLISGKLISEINKETLKRGVMETLGLLITASHTNTGHAIWTVGLSEGQITMNEIGFLAAFDDYDVIPFSDDYNAYRTRIEGFEVIALTKAPLTVEDDF